jgi:hypothetical protein
MNMCFILISCHFHCYKYKCVALFMNTVSTAVNVVGVYDARFCPNCIVYIGLIFVCEYVPVHLGAWCMFTSTKGEDVSSTKLAGWIVCYHKCCFPVWAVMKCPNIAL